MKIVAISQRVDSIQDRNEIRDAIDQKLCLWLIQAGYLPVPVPNTLCTAESKTNLENWLSSIKPDAVILSGGNDIGEKTDRDQTEFALIEYAKIKKLPLLGICRGMQILGAHFGIGLKSITGHVATKHNIKGEISGLVNSFHNYVLCDCPENFRVTASSQNDEIEAIHHNFLPWEGWMWHPERETTFSTQHILRLQELFQ